MKRVFAKYLTLLFIFLVSLCAHSGVLAHQKNTNSFTFEDLIKIDKEDILSKVNPQSFQYLTLPSSSENDFEIKAIEDVEVEEYEWVSVKKLIQKNNTLTVLFYTLFSDYILKENSKGISFPEDLSPHSSVQQPLYIAFCVYRI
ncbi:hypothetical protein [Mesonia aestuariivivens]|uniref:Uncharacterized protein n=1 Tax=Mesonia aestuariivivens TaxID=2796128 RepID=A0ABS6W2G7_9FLAO|nr:hypothetical protein [Mesonia aestuariivivens]MBW2962043.1 hypothetical protein [Mesonia aestuariivivens]